MHLTDPLKAVREMIRVTRANGIVSAFERGSLNVAYIPGQEKLTKLAIRLGEAWSEGARKMRRKYYSIGKRLPTIFHNAGLRDIMAEVQADAYLNSDPRRKLEDVRDDLEFSLASFRETRKLDTEAMLAGGASRKNIVRYNTFFEKWVRDLLKDDEKLREDTTFGAGGLFLVAGRKP